jgi:hypothetical protein
MFNFSWKKKKIADPMVYIYSFVGAIRNHVAIMDAKSSTRHPLAVRMPRARKKSQDPTYLYSYGRTYGTVALCGCDSASMSQSSDSSPVEGPIRNNNQQQQRERSDCTCASCPYDAPATARAATLEATVGRPYQESVRGTARAARSHAGGMC